MGRFCSDMSAGIFGESEINKCLRKKSDLQRISSRAVRFTQCPPAIFRRLRRFRVRLHVGYLLRMRGPRHAVAGHGTGRPDRTLVCGAAIRSTQNHTTVLGTPLCGVVIRHRIRFTIAVDHEPITQIHALRLHVVRNSLGAALRQIHVVLFVAGAVRIAVDLTQDESYLRILQHRDDRVDLRLVVGGQFSRVERESPAPACSRNRSPPGPTRAPAGVFGHWSAASHTPS